MVNEPEIQDLALDPDQDGDADLPEDLGEWNERLDPKLQDCLKRLAQSFCDEFRYPRRLQVMTDWKARCFWRELQHLSWNWGKQSWEAGGPFGTKDGTKAQNQDSAVLYSTNIYQGFGESYIAILTQSVPQVRFEPEDPDEPADIETAKACEPLRKIIQHENDPIKLMTKAAYHSWNGGLMAAWTRWQEDKRTHKPREFQSIQGAMEVKTPITADAQEDFLYLQFSKEYALASVRSKVKGRDFPPDYWKKIKGGASGDGQDAYERTARISVTQGISLISAGGDAYANLCTTQRTWMRPEAFLADMVEDGDRDELFRIFPDGAYVEHDSGVYTGSRNENMDECWAVENIMEGDGQFRNGKGTCVISVQERFNDIINLTQDVYEKTVPAAHMDDVMFDIDAMKDQVAMPGARYGLDLSGMQVGDTVAAHAFFEPAATVSADMLQYAKELMSDIPEFLTGISSILFGADSEGDKSGKALSIQQNAAMGRIGLPWRTLKRFYAKMMEQAVRCAARNRTDDMRAGVPDQFGKIETIAVRIEDLVGSVRCVPADAEGLPLSSQEKSQRYMLLLQQALTNPVLAQTLALPKNQMLAKQFIGIEDLEIAGAASWAKQMMEIGELLAEAPVPFQPPPVPIPNPLGPLAPPLGMINPPMQLQTSIPIDAKWDDNSAEYLTIKIWINDAAGQKAKKDNPPGFMNVQLHGQMHEQAMAQAAAAAAPPPPPAAPPANHLHIHPGGEKPAGAAPPAAAAIAA